jgi:hypothetical protein
MKLTDKEKEQVNEWTTALRSGELKQGSGSLYHLESDSFCCLGVGCTIEGGDTKKLDGVGLPSDILTYDDAGNPTDELHALMDKFEDVHLVLTEPDYHHDKTITTLAELNDDGLILEDHDEAIAFTFPMLANLIDCIARDKEGEIYTTDDLLEVAREGIE